MDKVTKSELKYISIFLLIGQSRKTGNIGYNKLKKNKAKTQHNNIHRDVQNVFGHCNV
jgi:hypothetical protein